MEKSVLPVRNISCNEKKLCGEEDLVKILEQHFGHSEFRGKQLEAIQAVLSGRDCFCLMPTGGGKSMCYQVPALVKTGVVLVVCPLIALMENQVKALKEKKIVAEYLSSTQASHVRQKIHEDLSSGKPSLRLLYVTPELIATPGFMSKLTKLYARRLLNLIVIDEAHCVSTWGHDFRPSYRNLSSLRKCLPDVPILALTATAAPKVEKDVIESLCLRHPLIFRSSFNRPNIFYEVRYKDLLKDAYADLSNQLKANGGPCSIVYCLERTTCDNVAAHLLKNSISCAAYHAGLNSKLRSSVLDDWLSSRIQVVVATVAFGMGIDRKDVRIVCHYNIPKSMEAFYQESGRAGRDQMPSRSLLYYGIEDYKKLEFILSNSDKKKQPSGAHDESTKKLLADFKQMVEYCEGSGCRRKKILESFGEQVRNSLCKNSCDACKHPNMVAKYLEELTYASNSRWKNAASRIFINSSSSFASEDKSSEFWNRDDEAGSSEEDISDSDDATEVVKNLACSKKLSEAGLHAKFDLLQQAEESYYQKKVPSKQNASLDKKAISEALREASRERLLNALNQAQQRLGNLGIDFEPSVATLENECYQKYGKVGKTFYNSQMASTIRWLSTSKLDEISSRLSTIANRDNGCKPNTLPTSPLTSADPDEEVQGSLDKYKEENYVDLSSKTCSFVPPTKLPSPVKELPPIPSFSQFVDRKGKGGLTDQPALSTKRLPSKLPGDPVKKTKL